MLDISGYSLSFVCQSLDIIDDIACLQEAIPRLQYGELLLWHMLGLLPVLLSELVELCLEGPLHGIG